MRDIYLYEDCGVLKNLMNIKDKKILEDAEADYVTYRLKEIAIDILRDVENVLAEMTKSHGRT